ncbi:MAG: tRNA (adenosine(37)-N6)-threonylcarbamoyltransferase complex dimerization subunit type 1 TsaB [Acidobacteriaceae bacterium]
MTLQNAVLSIDTCGQSGTVALVNLENNLENDATIVTCISQDELGGRAAAAQLMPAVDRMLREAALDLGALRSILVVNGPGSFTGIRVGLSTAKGLAHATGVPIVSISRLAVLASSGNIQQDSLSLLDAGRNEFYARRGEREWLAIYDEIASAAEVGTQLIVAESTLAERLAAWRPALVGPIDACAAVRAALGRLRSGESEDLAALDANYLRRSDAELFARPAPAPAR